MWFWDIEIIWLLFETTHETNRSEWLKYKKGWTYLTYPLVELFDCQLSESMIRNEEIVTINNSSLFLQPWFKLLPLIGPLMGNPAHPWHASCTPAQGSMSSHPGRLYRCLIGDDGSCTVGSHLWATGRIGTRTSKVVTTILLSLESLNTINAKKQIFYWHLFFLN